MENGGWVISTLYNTLDPLATVVLLSLDMKIAKYSCIYNVVGRGSLDQSAVCLRNASEQEIFNPPGQLVGHTTIS